MTKREKFLILFAGILLVVYVTVQFVIFPLFARYTDLQANLNITANEVNSAEFEISHLPQSRIDHDTARQRLEQLHEIYPPLVNNETIDVLMTNLVMSHDLFPALLNISNQATPSSESSNDEEADYLTSVIVNMNLIGNLESVQNLIYEVTYKPFMRITNFIYLANTTGNPDLSTQSITFELIYINN